MAHMENWEYPVANIPGPPQVVTDKENLPSSQQDSFLSFSFNVRNKSTNNSYYPIGLNQYHAFHQNYSRHVFFIITRSYGNWWVSIRNFRKLFAKVYLISLAKKKSQHVFFANLYTVKLLNI